MKKYSCPTCHTTRSVIRKTKRGTSILYRCHACQKHFSINTHWKDTKAILSDHLDGLSFRRLGRKYGMSPMSAWRICERELAKLPTNNQFTFTYCSQFSRTLVVDGKYFNVAGEEYDWVLLWGIDYFRHDIPVILVAPSEGYQPWSKFFYYFRIIQHYPDLVVCDDNANCKMAARKHFPSVRIQTCFNHFKENIRRDLRVRSEDTYKPFMKRLEDVLTGKLNDTDMNKRLGTLYHAWQHDPVAVSVLANIERYRTELTGYRGVPYAKLWLNGYVLKRRYTVYTDCREKFRFLNGKTGVQLTKKPEVDLPPLF